MDTNELITELEYLLERGLNNNAQIILHAFIGSLKMNDTGALVAIVKAYSTIRSEDIRRTGIQ